MEPYVFNANAEKHFKKILHGGEIDKHIFNVQDGDGIANFFAPLFKSIIPIAKSIGSSLLGIAKPAAKAAGREAIKGMATAGLTSLTDKTIESVRRSRKRKKSSKSSSRKRLR